MECWEWKDYLTLAAWLAVCMVWLFIVHLVEVKQIFKRERRNCK